jgi:4-nitrophenyl phosphatase
MNELLKELKSRERNKDLLKRIKCFILDLDGTVYLEESILDGSLDFLMQLEKMNIEFKFFTNNSSKNAEAYVNRIRRMGYPVQEDKMLISNAVIIEHLLNNMPDKKVYLLGTEYLRLDFEKAGISLVDDNPDIVVVGFDTTLVYEKVSKACHYIRNGAVFYGVNPDFNCPVKDGFIPDCGAMCAMITASTGVKPTFFGKPSHYTLDYVKRNTGFKESEIAFVGDRLYTDIAIGNGNDALTILVLTGESKEEDVIFSETKPKMICESLKEVKEILEEI